MSIVNLLRRLGLSFLIGLLCAVGLGLPAAANLSADEQRLPCVQRLVQRQILPPGVLRGLDETVSQGNFAATVLRAFPGAFATANEALGLTFEAARSQTEALLMAALGEQAAMFRPISRSQALAILVTGSATPYQSTATQSLFQTFRDALLIPRANREGVAAALAQGYIPQLDRPQLLRPQQPASLADSATMICLASRDPEVAGTIAASQAVAFEPPPAIAAPSSELRGVWLTNIDSDVLFSRERLAAALETLASLNFNTVYPTVWNWGYTLFPSAVAERTLGYQQGLYPDLEQTGRQTELEATQGDRDMLLELINLAQPLGLKVIPWFEFGFMAPADSTLAQRHPDWLTQKNDGSLTTPEGTHERVWLNPFHPEVQQFMLALIGELVSNYDIDGFQVDDHMGLPVAYGYDPYTVNLYQQEHGGALPPEDPTDADWVRWRADKITDFMGEVFEVVKARRPNAVMSVAPNPHEFAYEYYLQDWATWVERGYVEELVIQLYRNDLGRFVWEMGRDPAQTARRHIPTSVGILSGLKGRSVPLAQIQQQIEAVRDRGFAGVAFFFYETLWTSETETPEQRQAGFRQVFPNEADYPSLEGGWQP